MTEIDFTAIPARDTCFCKRILPINARQWKSLTIFIKALSGMLARLHRGRKDMLGSMDGKHGAVYVEYVSLMVSCYWTKVFISA